MQYSIPMPGPRLALMEKRLGILDGSAEEVAFRVRSQTWNGLIDKLTEEDRFLYERADQLREGLERRIQKWEDARERDTKAHRKGEADMRDHTNQEALERDRRRYQLKLLRWMEDRADLERPKKIFGDKRGWLGEDQERRTLHHVLEALEEEGDEATSFVDDVLTDAADSLSEVEDKDLGAQGVRKRLEEKVLPMLEKEKFRVEKNGSVKIPTTMGVEDWRGKIEDLNAFFL